jgi:benzoyl-CoA reductase/2-hydroxyglutaryl-CoA dehydratase subunit BcrC/BadD/HgdB
MSATLPNYERSAEEAKLQELLRANAPEQRKKWALKAKFEGQRVVGLLCTFVPEELILAAGMFPWRVTGTWQPNVYRSLAWRDLDMCKYATHVLESMLEGEYDFLDGVIASDWDDDRRRLYDVWKLAGRQAFVDIITMPKKATELSVGYFTQELNRLTSRLAQAGGRNITADGIREAIETRNQTRRLIGRLYEMRKRDIPPLTGAEFLGLTTAAMVMDSREFNQRLEELRAYLETRDCGIAADKPRVMISSDQLDHPAYVEIVENEGCLVAMDDLDTGSRYCWEMVDTEAVDPIEALARRYARRPQDPPALEWEAQAKQTMDWVKEFNIDGVIELADDFSPPRRWRWPFFRRALEAASIPVVRIPREYGLAGIGSLQTRVRAFLEMIGQELM